MFSSVGRSFHPGRQIAKDSKHHYEGNNCLKEIVSNTRLDLQTGSDYFFGFFPANVLIVHLLLGLFFFTVLEPNNRKTISNFFVFPFLHKSACRTTALVFLLHFFCFQTCSVYVNFFISVRFFLYRK